MLTLLLVLGAVTCSPVPSDLPSIPDAAHVEVTHEVRQVTFEVSAEVNEATASSQIPSDVPPEEDPPIPTVTTPHTAPEVHHQHQTHDDSIERHVVSKPQETEGEITEEASTEHEMAAVKSLHEEIESNEKKTEVESLEKSGETLPESSSVTQIENVEERELKKEAIVRSSSETLELVPESQIFLSKEDTNDSQRESVIEELPTDTFAASGKHNEENVSDQSTKPDSEVSIAAHNEPEQRQVEHANEENGDTIEKEVESTSGIELEEERGYSDVAIDSVIKTEHGGEEVPEIPPQVMHGGGEGSEFLDTEKRTDTDDLPAHEEPVSEDPIGDIGVVAPSENTPETTRESRVYVDYENEESTETQDGKEEHTVPEQVKTHLENEPKPANSGLESMSMTSPTPESLSDTVPLIDDLEKEEAPPAENQETDDVTMLPEIDSQEENSTLIAEAEEPDIVPEVVINPPSSSISPLTVEEYTDNYGDPLNFGDLPDFDVTHEHLPSKDHPLPKDAKLIPKQTHDHVEQVNKGDSSDLAAGDHMLEVEAGSPRVLPPQQEQVSAAAPSSLTPGCIVAIVFGVLVSLVVILGVGGFMIWQRRTQNRPKVLGNDQGYAGSDSGGYIDDQVRVSYVNSQTDTPKAQTSQGTQESQGPQVLIRLKSLKPSLPTGTTEMLKRSLPTMPKIAPMNMPNISQFITKRESGGSHKPGQ